MKNLPWLGWYDKNGEAHLSTWEGIETKLVFVSGISEPHDGIPDGERVIEVSSHAQGRRLSHAFGKGIVVIVPKHWKASD